MNPRPLLAACSLALLLPSAARASTPVVVTGLPVGKVPSPPGSGLCTATSISTSPSTDFSTVAATYSSSINSFLEAHVTSRQTAVYGTALDLSNSYPIPAGAAAGDFTSSVSTCPPDGCLFVLTGPVVSFATRFRGYLAVPAALAGSAFHLGIYTDDAASVTVFDAARTPYPIVTLPPVLGSPTWRATNTVTFSKAGLYPIEILYAQISEAAALEVSMFTGSFTDIDTAANQPPVTNLGTAGFTLIDATSLYETLTGGAPEADPMQCMQCDRQYAGAAGTTGCRPEAHCNDAAICEACINDAFCGPTCAPCGPGSSCIGGACVSPDAGSDGSGTGDAGRDAGHDAGRRDAGKTVDAGGDASNTGAPSSGGCGCRVAEAKSSGRGWAALALAVGLGLGRRRRAAG